MATRHLLVIDDEPFVGQVIRRLFEKGPFTVSTAPDGASGLQLLRDHPEIACAFVDINMPGMSGLDVIAQAAENPRLANVALVVLTAVGDDQIAARARALGARAFIAKPFSPHKLYRQITELLGVNPDAAPEA